MTEEPDAADEPEDGPEPAEGDEDNPAGDATDETVRLTPAQQRMVREALRTLNTSYMRDVARIAASLPAINRSYQDLAKRMAEAMSPLQSQIRAAFASQSLVAARYADLNKQLAALQRQVADTIAPQLQSLAGLVRIDPNLLRSFRETVMRTIPENFQGLKVDEWFTAITLGIEHRIGVVFALPPARLAALVALTASCESEAVDELLEGFESDDLDYLESVLARVATHDERLAGLAVLLMDASSALRSGNAAASQALSTVVWDTEITHLAGGNKAITVAKKLATDLDDEQSVSDLFRAAVFGPLVRAYLVPNTASHYGRNPTVHGANPAQFTKVNAVRALTIAVSLLAWRATH